MKKFLAVVTALIVTLSLCACGGGPAKQTKDELLASATTVDADAIMNDIGGNQAKAKGYIGSIYCITGHVVEICEDYAIVLAADTGDWNNVIHSDDWEAYAELAVFRVYLSTDELAQLTKCENIQFVGEITATGTFDYYKIEPLYLDVTNAYLVKTNVKYDGRQRL